MDKIRIVTLKKDIPDGITSHKGFHLLNMGKEGMWLVDEEHPGYPGCVKKSIELAKIREDDKSLAKYFKLNKEIEKRDEKPKVEPKKATPAKKVSPTKKTSKRVKK